jgi:hypothetical protein
VLIPFTKVFTFSSIAPAAFGIHPRPYPSCDGQGLSTLLRLPPSTAVPHSLDGRDRSRPSPLQIPRHCEHFQPTIDVPDIPHTATPDRKTIIRWESYLDEMHPTHLFCPVVLVDGEEIANSKVIFCCDRAKWIHYGGTVSHYKDHARRHEDYAQRCRGLSNRDDPAVHFVSFIFQTGAPARAIQTLRKAWPGEDLPNRQNLSQIMQMVKARVKEAIRIERAADPFVNIALDGWTDPNGRKFEWITIPVEAIHALERVFATNTCWKAILSRQGVHSLGI